MGPRNAYTPSRYSVDALTQAFAEGACNQLLELGLESNWVSQRGCDALADAVSNGALPEIQDVYLGDNMVDNNGQEDQTVMQVQRDSLRDDATGTPSRRGSVSYQ